MNDLLTILLAMFITIGLGSPFILLFDKWNKEMMKSEAETNGKKRRGENE